MTEPLKTPNGSELNLDKCSPWQIVEACIQQEEEARDAFRGIYQAVLDNPAEKHPVSSMSSALTATIANQLTVERMKTMDPQQIRNIFKKAVEMIQHENGSCVLRSKLDEIVRQAIDETKA